ncbi:MAG: hypothetical protein A3I68_02840 [Candidatus Melainabacteria bacterium RIFCSPLOWO2_02_FULL_35_15]|nr:MAG: hypothetical protein A3F80_01175 [Candidatus Melainabacteria bacterium RIFCSPLOWO2_12_FULL_35_11]OGI13066.1 MAG: hypothetical protein A3I68_02840 [Candidatus Melainabacteria bacterium RIFCSPLOWO2_02_FULL_35_15]
MSTITFEELKNKYQNKIEKDTEVNCRLLAKLKDGYLVDINDEWEGFIPGSHILNYADEANLHETFKALVISGSDKSDRYTVSPKALKEKSVWEMLEKLKEESKSLKVTIAKVIKGGVEVFIDGLRAFLPGRYIKLPGISQDSWVNQEIDVLIEELDYKEKKIILNQKKAVDLEKQKRAEIAIKDLHEGDIVEAPVLRIAEFGVFMNLGGLDGLIPASELSWGRFAHPKDVVKVGQTVQARIFRIERENLRVALSIKQLLGDPWEQLESEVETGQLVTGKVINEAPFGLFVELKPGVEALLHNSEISEGIEKPKVGSVINAKIIKIDLEQRKIGLSFRDVEQKPVASQEQEIREQQTSPPPQNFSTELDNELNLVTTQINPENSALIESISEN